MYVCAGVATALTRACAWFRELPAAVVEGCSRLVELKLDHNVVETLPPKAMGGMLRLQVLDLSNNKLAKVQRVQGVCDRPLHSLTQEFDRSRHPICPRV